MRAMPLPTRLRARLGVRLRSGVGALVLAGASAWPLAGAAPSAAQEAGEPAPGEVRGVVHTPEGTGLEHVWIRYRTADGVWALTRSEPDGSYRLRVPPGRLHLEAERIGYRPAALEVVVPAGATARVDLRLEPRPVDLEGILVRTDRFAVARVPPAELRAMSAPAPEVALTTMVLDGGLAEVASAVATTRDPQGDQPGGASQLLLLRGSSADLKLLLLDGAPVYTPFHLSGLLDGFDNDLLGRASHLMGAAPTRLDGGVDYILDLGTRPPRVDGDLHLRGHLDLLSAGATAEWGTPGGGVLLSGRSLHGEGFRGVGGGDVPYGYADGIVRGRWQRGGLTVDATGFANRESVELGLSERPALPEQAKWSNRLLSLRATHAVGATRWSWGVSASSYGAELPLRADSSVTSRGDPVLARGSTGRLRATVEGVREVGDDTSLRFGLTADHTATTYGSTLHRDAGSQRTEMKVDGRTIGGHLEWATAISPSLAGRMGVRFDHYTPGGFRGALRGSLAWALSPTAVLTLAGGRYHQFARPPGDLLPSGVDPLVIEPTLTSSRLQIARSDHALVGLDQDLTTHLRLGLQGYVKRFDHLGGAPGTRRSSGVDLRVVGEDGVYSGWLGYSLSWNWTDGTGHPGGGTETFLGRHLLTAGFRGPLVGALGIDARVSFSDGLPLTEVPLEMASGNPVFSFGNRPDRGEHAGDTPGPVPAPPPSADGFLRIDLEFHGEWDAPVGEGTIRPYLKVMNALDRRDALFYYFEPWRDGELTPLARRTILPVVGLAWRF